jgi:uncharacterized ferritin-like protein (DUF455 family)
LRAVEVIRREEVGHVQFGSRWYHRLCAEMSLDAHDEFARRLERLFTRIPRRLEPIQPELRRSAGFTDSELETLEGLRQRWLKKDGRIHSPVS